MIYVPYAGVGSRRTPSTEYKKLNTIGKKLDQMGLTLRSGGATGPDTEFERMVRRSKEIFRPTTHKGRLPYGHMIIDGEMRERAIEIVSKTHPIWDKLEPWNQELHIRNVFQVLGADLESYSLFVLCWTPDGADGTVIKTSSKTGGTGTAIRVAANYGIPVINLNNPDSKGLLSHHLKEIGVTK